MGHTQNKKTNFFQKKQNLIRSFQKPFILSKDSMFWLSYECFSILRDAFLLKSVISSQHNPEWKMLLHNFFVSGI